MHHDIVVPYPKRAHRKGVRKSFWLLLLVFFSISLAALYLASPLALVAEITVTGNEKLQREEILATAGLEPGQHLWRLNLAEGRDKLSAIPWVAEVKIARVFPNILAITLQEREAVAIIPGPDQSWVAAGDGMVLTVNDGWSLPWVTGLTPEAMEPGFALEGQAALVALEWVLTLQPMGSQVSELNFSLYPSQVSLFTTDGYKVVFAADADLPQRVSDLIAMLQVLRGEQHKGVIDFRTGEGRGTFSPWPNGSGEGG